MVTTPKSFSLKVIFGLLTVLALFIYFFYMGKNENTETLLTSQSIDHDNIIYMEKGQDKTIVFYSEKISSLPCIGIAVFENIRGQERRLLFYGSRSYNNESALIWDSQGTEIGIGKKPIRLVYGIVNDSRIDDISIYTTNNIYTDVNIIQTPTKKIWFREIEFNTKSIKLRALTSQKEILWSLGDLDLN